VVNVDIVICGPNVEFIDKIMTLAIRLGVREFDLLQVQPSGRAADQEGILFDLEAARPSLERALNYRKRPDLFLWTNRLPLAYLEGHEELIQSPTKLLDEINGRRDQAELLLTRGEPFRCRGPLCQACFMAPLCDELHQYAERLHRHSWTRIVVDLRDGCPPSVTTPKVREVQVVANDLAQLEKATKNAPTLHPDVPLSLWLGRPKGLTEGLAATPGQLEGRSLERLASDDVIVLQAALDAEIAEVEVTPKKRNLAWLEAHLTTPLVLRARPGTPLSTARREDIPPHELADLLARSVWTVEDWPHCLAGGRPVRWTDQPLLAVASGAEAATGLDDWVRHFAARRYRTFSSRCPSCSHQACRGQLVQLVRAFGLKWLQPEGSGG
jgi:hypothetical protein